MVLKKIMIDADLFPLAERYLKSKSQDVQLYFQWIQENDFDSIQFLAHQLKGVAGSYGFHQLSEIGEQIETAASQKNASVTSEHVARLALALQSIEIESNQVGLG